MTSTYLSAFTNQLEALGSELTTIFPNDLDLKAAYKMISTLKKINPRRLLDFFNKYVIVYRDKILNKDETFFLDNEFNELSENDSSISIIKQLKTHWNEMSPNSREATWNYFIVLVKLSDKISKE